MSESSFPECENFIAHYLLGCDEVTDDLLGAKKLCFNGEHFYPFVLQSCRPPLTAEATNKESSGLEGTAGSLIKVHTSDRTLFLIWFNSPLLLKNSICLIELFDGKAWIPCILTVHINFPSVQYFIKVLYRQRLNLNLVTSQAYKKIRILFSPLKPKLKWANANQGDSCAFWAELNESRRGKRWGMGVWSVKGCVCACFMCIFSHFNRWHNIVAEMKV